MTVHLVYLIITLCCFRGEGNEQTVTVDSSTTPPALAQDICINSRDTCLNFVLPVIELQKFLLFSSNLTDWHYNEACGCFLPPQTKLSNLQYFHIPKSGTSINWFLRDYFDDCEGGSPSLISEDPCPSWLTNVRPTILKPFK